MCTVCGQPKKNLWYICDHSLYLFWTKLNLFPWRSRLKQVRGPFWSVLWLRSLNYPRQLEQCFQRRLVDSSLLMYVSVESSVFSLMFQKVGRLSDHWKYLFVVYLWQLYFCCSLILVCQLFTSLRKLIRHPSRASLHLMVRNQDPLKALLGRVTL